MSEHPVSARSVARVSRAISLIEGEDVPVRRAFAAHGGVYADPFLMLDHFGPAAITADSQGFPPHPHRGFETVTYLLDGEIEHEDSFGGQAVIGPGDVQWMTAGAGLIHSEMPPQSFKERGGTLEGLQLWVNLPKADKSARPHYQILRGGDLAEVVDEARGLRAIVIAGEMLGARGPASTHSPMTVAVLTLEDESTVTLDVAPDMNAALYVASGAIATGRDRRHVEEGHTAFFAPGDAPIVVGAIGETRLLFVAGRPLNEPVVARGPFVMTTEGEIRQAMLDYQAGKFGA